MSKTLYGFYQPHEQIFAPHSDEMITVQDAKDECDINNIIKQYQQTGIYNHVSAIRPTFEDLPAITDYQEALNVMMAAEDSFEALPSKVRDYFQNDPGELLSALNDPAQADKLREFGILAPLPDPEARTPQPPSGGSGDPPAAPPTPPVGKAS